MGFPTTGIELFKKMFDMFFELYDVTSYGCDVFIEVAQLGPDRIRGGVGVEMTFPNDDLEK